MTDLLHRSQASKLPVDPHIGGGSPNLLGKRIGDLLQYIGSIPGVSHHTEISLEMEIYGTRKEFIEELVKYPITRISMGIQTCDLSIRKALHLPPQFAKQLDGLLAQVGHHVPVINVDLLTSLPGQTIDIALKDVNYFLNRKEINSISSYLLVPSSAPEMVSRQLTGTVPFLPSPAEEANMRYETLKRLHLSHWSRRGTSTYVNPKAISPSLLKSLSGNEAIGKSRYESFLLGAGPGAVSHVPGVKLKQMSDNSEWIAGAAQRQQPIDMASSHLKQQKDCTLWLFPLRHEGLKKKTYDLLKSSGSLNKQQIANFNRLLEEGLVVRHSDHYSLSLLGEVFMGNLVRELKKTADRKAADLSIKDGFYLAKRLAQAQHLTRGKRE